MRHASRHTGWMRLCWHSRLRQRGRRGQDAMTGTQRRQQQQQQTLQAATAWTTHAHSLHRLMTALSTCAHRYKHALDQRSEVQLWTHPVVLSSRWSAAAPSRAMSFDMGSDGGAVGPAPLELQVRITPSGSTSPQGAAAAYQLTDGGAAAAASSSSSRLRSPSMQQHADSVSGWSVGSGQTPPPGMIHPNNVWLSRWSLLIMVLSVYCVITVPYRISFWDQPYSTQH